MLNCALRERKSGILEDKRAPDHKGVLPDILREESAPEHEQAVGNYRLTPCTENMYGRSVHFKRRREQNQICLC